MVEWKEILNATEAEAEVVIQGGSDTQRPTGSSHEVSNEQQIGGVSTVQDQDPEGMESIARGREECP